MKTGLLKTTIALALAVCAFAGTANAFPSWIGVYGDFQRHASGNPGTFTVLMNRDYYGLRAEVGVQVDGGAWNAYQMTYAGNISGNSKWQLTPATAFPSGATVKFYFHGYDSWGGHIWDSANGQNYSFVAEAAGGLLFSGVQNIGLGGWQGVTADAAALGGKAFALANGQINAGSVNATGVTWAGWSVSPGMGRAVAVSTSHVVVAGFSGSALQVARSADGGGSFSSPVALNVTTGTIQSMDMTARGSEFVIVYSVSPDEAYYNAHDLFAVRSADHGATWGAPALVDQKAIGWFDGLSAGANAGHFFVVYRYVEQAYATSVRAAHSADGASWTSAHLFGDKAASTFAALVTADGAYAALDPYYDNATRFARFNAGSWEITSIAHPEGYASGRAVKLGALGTDLYFFRIDAYPANLWQIRKSSDQGWTWNPAGAIQAPEPVMTFPAALQHVLTANGRMHLVWANSDWRYGANLWQVTVRAAGGPVNWVGNTYHWPPNSQITSTNNLWINMESWPAGNAIGAGAVYSTDGANWTWVAMSANGRAGNNDAWHVDLGQFFSGTTIRYAVYAEDGAGNKRWDSHNGQDYRAVVQSNSGIHAPFFYKLDPYRGDVERVRANGRTKDANLSFGSFTPSQNVTISTRPVENGNGESVQFGPVEMVSYLVYATDPSFANAQTVYGDFHSAAFSNKPIFDYTSFNLGSFPTGTTVYFWIGSGNSKGSGYAQSYGEVFGFSVQ